MCVLGRYTRAEVEWLVTESEGPCNFIDDLQAFQSLILDILYKTAA